MKIPASHLALFLTLLAALVGPSATASATDAQRQADIASRSPAVMPFDLAATTHIFTKMPDGGRQRVVTKRVADTRQVERVRGHLRDIKREFLAGDFSGPEHIHGAAMPGLAELKAANPGQISIGYKDVAGGAELSYRTSDAALVAALHRWFDAQLLDHGADAMAGHPHPHEGLPKP
jgi:hypothetical protein